MVHLDTCYALVHRVILTCPFSTVLYTKITESETEGKNPIPTFIPTTVYVYKVKVVRRRKTFQCKVCDFPCSLIVDSDFLYKKCTLKDWKFWRHSWGYFSLIDYSLNWKATFVNILTCFIYSIFKGPWTVDLDTHKLETLFRLCVLHSWHINEPRHNQKNERSSLSWHQNTSTSPSLTSSSNDSTELKHLVPRSLFPDLPYSPSSDMPLEDT